MTRERLYRTEAVVLHRADLGEADRLLTLYTPRFGRLRVVAKGVRKLTSRKAGHLELFAHSRLLVARGRNLDIVTQAELIEPYEGLREDLTRIGYAFHLAELVMRLTKEEIENPALFDLLLDALGWLAEGGNLRVTSRYVELRLLDHVGYRPQLFRCVRCNDEIRPVTNFMSFEEGGVLCPDCGGGVPRTRPLTMPALKILRFMQTRDYATCRRLQLRSVVLAELEEVLGNLLAFHMEARPRSLAFVRQLRREAAERG
jgi:DNA repair protein RecO (recombination protein O)